VFSQLGIWRWIFFVNVPVCLLAGGLIARNFRESVQRREHRIDYRGSVLLTSGMSLLILGVLEGGQAWAWDSAASTRRLRRRRLLLAAFALAERGGPRSRSAGVGAQPAAAGHDDVPRARCWARSDRPDLVRADLPGVLARGAAAGRRPRLAALTLGWPLSASLSGRLFYCAGLSAPPSSSGSRWSSRHRSARPARPHPSVVAAALSCFVIGMGMGLVATPSIIAAQASVEWHERGVATGTNMFARSLGSAVGAAAFGAVANGCVAASGRPATDPAVATESGAAVFLAVLVAVGITVVAGLLMPKAPVPAPDRPRRSHPSTDRGLPRPQLSAASAILPARGPTPHGYDDQPGPQRDRQRGQWHACPG
jgi:MFS family permease